MEPRLQKPWNVIGAGFNEDGVYYTLEGSCISRMGARLIEAAPELLEALQLAKHVVENMLPANSASRKRVSDLAGKAIKKALAD
ncbi:hypothetical protein [Flyfo siphovirus Tbat2_3]|nr:hypothetical protein [Flyfo siphovirus Tbat2_3]